MCVCVCVCVCVCLWGGGGVIGALFRTSTSAQLCFFFPENSLDARHPLDNLYLYPL